MGGAGAGEVAGGVERDPPVEADDQEGEQRLGEPAARVGPGRVAQVEPDRIGDAVGVVIDIEGDLAGRRVGHKVGEGRRVMAVGRDRPEDPRRRVGPVAGRVCSGPVVDAVRGVVADDPRAVERRDDHLAVGALDRQEPVLEVAGVVILVHPDGVGVAGLHQARITGEQAAIVAEVAVGGGRPHAGAVEGAEPATIEDEPCGAGLGLHQEVLPCREAVLGGGGRVVERGRRVDRRDPEDMEAAAAEGRGRVAVLEVIVEDLEGLVDRTGNGVAGVRQPERPAGEVITIERRISGGNRDIGQEVVESGGIGHGLDVGDGERGAGGGVGGEVAVIAGVVAEHVARQAMAPQGRADIAGIGDQLLQGEVHQLVGLGREDRLREVPRVDLALAGEGCEGDPDQGHQGEDRQDQDQDDAAATCRCERGGQHLIGPREFGV